MHGLEEAWNDSVKWVKDHADLIRLIGDLLSDRTGLLAVLAIITAPFANPSVRSSSPPPSSRAPAPWWPT